jgi:hypothetical protein
MAPPTGGCEASGGLSVFGDARFVPGTLLAGRHRVVGLLAGALLLTMRNLHLGGGDRRGAFRIAGILFAMLASAGVLGADLHPTPGAIFNVILLALAQAMLIGVCALVMGTVVALAVFGAWTSANLRTALPKMSGD